MTHVLFRAALLTAAVLVPALPQTACALQITGLYQERVAVSSESGSERNRAFAEALGAVILKVTGDPRWLDHATVATALAQARDYVEAVGYTSEMIPAPPVADAEPGDEPLAPPAMVEQRYIDVSFSEALLNRTLAAAGIPIWDSNRPDVLVWMALQNAAGEQSLLTADTHPDIQRQIQRIARERGLPVIFPVLDFEDRRNLPVDRLWALDAEAIANASRRYGADSVLAGRLLVTASGEMVGLWQFQFQDSTEVFDGFATELKDYLNTPLARITTRLARYFAIVPDFNAGEEVSLRVEGIGDLAAYSSLMNYVRGLSLVQSVMVSELDGQSIELQLGLQGHLQQLNQLIALDRDLLPIESTRDSEPGLLHYRWTRR